MAKSLHNLHLVNLPLIFMITLNSNVWQIVRDSPNLKQPFNLYPYGQDLSIRQTFLPNSFNLVIHQKLTPLNISAIQYMKPK